VTGIKRHIGSLCTIALVAACTQAPGIGGGAGFTPDATPDRPLRPEGAPEGSCWHLETTPAVIETATRQIIVQPAEQDSEGRVIRPAIWRTERAPRIVEERQERWIETPCPEVVTQDFVMSLQRALAARGYYRGVASGVLDRATRRAIHAFQAERGLDSTVLSLKSAQLLGLAVIELG